MEPTKTRYPLTVLYIGDAFVLLLVTLAGFATHKQSMADAHWLTTFLPLCAGWILAAVGLNLFHDSTTNHPREIWRAVLAAALAVPFAAWLRGLWLNTPIIPIFVTALGFVTILSLTLWRAVWAWISSRKAING